MSVGIYGSHRCLSVFMVVCGYLREFMGGYEC